MKNTSINTGRPLKVLALILCLGVVPMVSILTGCSTGDRYKQSTGEYIDDHGLSSHVKSALGEDTQYKYEDVNVVTFKGVVQLSGFVNTSDQKSRAGDIASKVNGVTEVKNNITIKQ
jgi:hyperosmotically inducible periplasmic protein